MPEGRRHRGGGGLRFLAQLRDPVLLAVTGSFPIAIALSAIFGSGSIVAEVVADTTLQRSLDPAIVARAYGFVVPADIAGIALGALLAPVFVMLFGLSGCLVIVGGAVIAYAALVLGQPRQLLRRHIARNRLPGAHPGAVRVVEGR